MNEEKSAYEVHPKHTGIKEKDGRSVRKVFGPWIKLSTEFRDRYLADLKGSQLSVFLCLALHLDQDYRAWPGVSIIAKKTGYNRRTVSRALEKLASKQLIVIEKRRSDGQQFANNRYEVQAFAGFGKSNPRDKMSRGTDPGDIITESMGHPSEAAECPPKKNQFSNKNQQAEVVAEFLRDPFQVDKAIALSLLEAKGFEVIMNTLEYVRKASPDARNPSGLAIELIKKGGRKLPKPKRILTAREFSQVYVDDDGNLVDKTKHP